MKTAILVDGGFYRRRSQIKIGEKKASERANELDNYCRRHLTEKKKHLMYRQWEKDGSHCPKVTNNRSRHKLIKKPGAVYVSRQTTGWLHG